MFRTRRRARIALLTHTPPQTMFTPTHTDPPTYRTPPTLGMALLFAALPVAMLFAATFPAATTGLVVGLTAGTALQR